jgi:hypothetical protein
MTKNEIVYNWLNLIKSGRISDDFTPSINQLSFIADYKRAQYIRQDQTKNYFDTDQFYQDLGCINMIKVDKAECCTIGLDCEVLRTEVKIPPIIRLKERYGLKISAVDRQTRFTIVLPERSPFLGNTKFPQLGLKVYFLNGYIYIPETLDIRALNVRAILEKPENAKTFICDGEACYTNNSDYPMTADMIDLITKDIMSTELNILMKMIPDETNDGTDKIQS